MLRRFRRSWCGSNQKPCLFFKDSCRFARSVLQSGGPKVSLVRSGLLSWGSSKIAPPPVQMSCVLSRVGQGPPFGSELPNSVLLPPLSFFPTSTVYSARHPAGLLHPASGHGVRNVSASRPTPAPEGLGPLARLPRLRFTLRSVPLLSRSGCVTALRDPLAVAPGPPRPVRPCCHVRARRLSPVTRPQGFAPLRSPLRPVGVATDEVPVASLGFVPRAFSMPVFHAGVPKNPGWRALAGPKTVQGLATGSGGVPEPPEGCSFPLPGMGQVRSLRPAKGSGVVGFRGAAPKSCALMPLPLPPTSPPARRSVEGPPLAPCSRRSSSPQAGVRARLSEEGVCSGPRVAAHPSRRGDGRASACRLDRPFGGGGAGAGFSVDPEGLAGRPGLELLAGGSEESLGRRLAARGLTYPRHRSSSVCGAHRTRGTRGAAGRSWWSLETLPVSRPAPKRRSVVAEAAAAAGPGVRVRRGASRGWCRSTRTSGRSPGLPCLAEPEGPLGTRP